MINIKKSQPAPLCLSDEKEKANGDYKCGHVLKRLKDDFHNKCYICEEREPSSINTEHFKPQKKYPKLIFDWNNLFFACTHCNSIKGVKDNLIDCTDNSEIITDLLKFEIKPFPREKAKVTPLISRLDINSTAQLLNEVYNGTTELKNIEGLNIRNKLIREIVEFGRLLQEYYDFGLTKEDKEYLQKKIKQKLSKEAPFTAFKIWIIKDNEELLKEFKELIN